MPDVLGYRLKPATVNIKIMVFGFGISMLFWVGHLTFERWLAISDLKRHKFGWNTVWFWLK